MKSVLVKAIATLVFFSSIQAAAFDTVYCANKKHGTELYLKNDHTLSMVNLADDGLALVDYADMFFTDEGVEAYFDDEGNRVITAMIPDHNFDWEVFATINTDNNTIDVHMVDTDAYEDVYEYTLVCDKELSLR